MNPLKKALVVTISALLSLCISLLPGQGFGPLQAKPAAAAGTITNDTANKRLTVSGGNVSLSLDYNLKSKIDSLKINSVETLDAGGILSSFEVPRGSTPVTTATLSTSPTVTVSGSTAVVSGISYQNAYLKVTETWTFTANTDDVQVKVDKTNDWISGSYTTVDMKSLGFTFKQSMFNTSYRGDGGSNTLISPADGTTLRSLTPGDKYYGEEAEAGFGYIGGDMDLLSESNAFLLKIRTTSSRYISSEIYRSATAPYSLQLDHKLSLPAFAHTLHNPAKTVNFHLFSPVAANVNNRHAYDPVAIADLQTDSITYTISAKLNLDDYYDIGSFPAASGINEQKFARFITEFGRDSIVDLLGAGGAWNALRPEYSGLMEMQWGIDAMLAMQTSASNRIALEALRKNTEMAIAVQEPSGHIRGVAGGQVYEFPEDSEADEAMPLAAAAYINATGDTAWANTVKAGIRKALDFRLSKDSNGNGLVEATLATNTGLSAQAYLDQVYLGGEDAYINALMYGALTQWADIEEKAIGDAAKAQYYRDKARKLKEAYNKDLIYGGLWSNTNQGFIGWRNMNGTMKADVKYVHVDSAAIKYGVANKERMQSILYGGFDTYQGLDDWMVRNQAKAYPLNLYPMDGTEVNPTFTASFPDWENGDVFPHTTGEMVGAYARAGSALPFKYIKNIVDLYYQPGDPYWAQDVFTWQLTGIFGMYTKMDVNMEAGATLITDVLGVKPKYDALEVNPVLDSSLFGTEINYNMRGHQYRIRYDGQLSRTLMQNDGAETVRFMWNNMKPGYAYTINDNGTSYSRTADENGLVTYNITAAGARTVTISDSMGAGTSTSRSGSGASTVGGSQTSAKAIDGNAATYWSSAAYADAGHSESVFVDTGANNAVKRVQVTPRSGGNGFPVDFKFQSSLDGIEWFDVPGANYSNYANPGSAAQTFSFNAPVLARYIRMHATRLGADGTGYAMQVAELQPYAVAATMNEPGIKKFKATSGFSSSQSVNNWNYQEWLWNGSTMTVNPMTWVGGRWKGTSDFSLIGSGWMHPDDNREAVRIYTAPQAGTVKVTGVVRLRYSGGNGIKVKILKNGSPWWPSSGYETITDITGVAFQGVTAVNQGDQFSFVVNNNGNSNSDTTYWAPQIAFVDTYNGDTDFSSTQGTKNWFYKEDAGGVLNNMTWDSANGRWKGSAAYSLITNQWQHPDAGQDAVRVFKAPRDGMIEITAAGNVRKSAAGGDGVQVRILKNNETVWPNAGGWQFIAGNDTTGLNMNVLLYVRQGDELKFYVNRYNTITSDSTTWIPQIQYAE
ncbi:discoidin domain-containing protein [Cohnella sp. GCM10012308]|uniref:discoidin domain-containing protein n=1 Tax=Cohnella sp. GCM10012308 TaxID=3317329 RepID=UPI0036140772